MRLASKRDQRIDELNVVDVVRKSVDRARVIARGGG